MQNRLDKLLVATGLYTRSEAKLLVRQGRVRVNGARIADSAAKFDAETDEIRVDGELLAVERFVYLMLHKPAGVLSATRDSTARTVLDLLPAQYQKLGLFPVGRLDKDSVGLMILTNDGALAHRLLHPKHHVEKEYYVEVDGVLQSEDAAVFAQGLVMENGEQFLPAKLEILASGSSCMVTLREGKYHQIKRMLASRGKPVRFLKRIRFGEILLDEALQPGEFRLLQPAEQESLRN